MTTLKNFYGKNNVLITGQPSYSFFDKRTHNPHSYLQTLSQNKIQPHTNFNTNNTKYEIEQVMSNYELDLNSILDTNKHHLLGRIVIYLYEDLQNVKNNAFINLQNIKLEIDEAIFEYDLTKLIGIEKKYGKDIFYKFDSQNLAYIDLPVELFEREDTWVNLRTPIKLKICFSTPTKIRIDFFTVTLDTEEQRRFTSVLTHPKDCILKHCDVIKCKLDLNNISEKKLCLNLSEFKCGIKEIFWSYFIDYDTLIEHSSIDKCVLKIINPNGTNSNENKYIEINQDKIQLLCSNNINNKNIKFPFYTFGFSLDPSNYHSTGDFYVNDFDVKLEIHFNDDIDNFKSVVDEKNHTIELVFFVNQMKFMRYYYDETKNNKLKCKFISISKIYEEENNKYYCESE